MIVRMDRTFLLVAALAGFTGVALGAFGAHGLRGRLSPEMLAVFETGVRYQMYHGLAIVAVSLMMPSTDGWLVRLAGWAFVAGRKRVPRPAAGITAFLTGKYDMRRILCDGWRDVKKGVKSLHA